MSIRRFASVGIIVVSVLVAACGSSTAGSTGGGSSSGVVKIGVPLPLTGKLAQAGNQLLAGINYAAQQVNQQGGVNGRHVQVITADTQGDPSTAVHAATTLITQDKVDALVGGYGSTADEAMLTGIARYGKLFVHTSSSSIKIEQSFGSDNWYFHVYIWDPYRATALTKFINTLSPRPTRIAIAHESGLYGTTGAQQAKDDLTAAGYTVVDNIPFTAGASDFTPVIQKVKNDHADVFYWLGYPGDNVLMVQQAHAQHLTVKLMIDVAAGETLKQYGEPAAQGLVSVDVFNQNEQISNLPTWVAGVQKAENVPPTGAVAQGYAGMITLLDAMKNAKSTNQTQVIQHLAHDQFWTPFGTLGYRSDIPGDKHQLLLPDDQVVYQYRGASTVVVWPQSKANDTVTYPVTP